MPFWADLYKVWQLQGSLDSLQRREVDRHPEGAGVLSPDAISDIRSSGEAWGGQKGVIKLRDSNDFVDLSSVTNRQSRYKEYERLRVMPEIENAITIFADEACISGNTLVATPFGFLPIEKLARDKKPEDKFLVYCYNFEDSDYTLGWAHHPRKVKQAKTVVITLEGGEQIKCTPDHRILLFSGKWIEAGNIKEDDRLMPFYRERAATKHKRQQFPRIFTNSRGWMKERDFIDEWRTNKRNEKNEKLYRITQCISEGCTAKQVCEIVKNAWPSIHSKINNNGFSFAELKKLGEKSPFRRVIGVWEGEEQDVYDLSVDNYENFCTDTVVVHNCQIGEKGHMFDVVVKNSDVKAELDFLFFHPSMLNIDDNLWAWTRDLFLFGDHFMELVIDPDEPKLGILKVQSLPPESMYRIETIKGKVIEFQQSKEGPDYQSLARVEVEKASEADLAQATALRFAPESIVHFRIGGHRKQFYPYGISLIENARGPAHTLKLMEDSMVVYRLCVSSYVKLWSDNGWKYISDVKPGDNVLALDDSGNTINVGVLWQSKTGTKPVYKIKSQTTTITATNNHPILVKNKETDVVDYVAVKNLIPKVHQFAHITNDKEVPQKLERFYGDIFARLNEEQKQQVKSTTYEIKKAAKIRKVLKKHGMEYTKKNMNSVHAFLMNKHNVKLPVDIGTSLCEEFDLGQPILLNEHEKYPERINLPEYVDEEFASLLGFLIGDGCTNYNNNSAQLLFSTGTILEINEKYKNLFIKYFGWCSFRKEKRSARPEIGEYVVSSYAAARIMENMGLKGDCYTKRVPHWLFSERKEIRKAFLLGLADADGVKRDMDNKNWASYIRLTNKELIYDIKMLWMSLGLYASHVNKFDSKEVYFKGEKYIQKESWGVNLINKPIEQYEDILSIEGIGEEDVYDIGVDNDCHNFAAEGVIIHNSRAPERKVFYIDVGQLPPFKAEAFMGRLQDMFRKKKTHSQRGGNFGSASVEERWQAPSADEDYWIPLRPNSNTRVETLPGASSLGEVDDVLFFRNKLFISMGFPKNYMAQDDPSVTRVTLSSIDIKFSRLIERLQRSMRAGILDIATRHLQLRGYPTTLYDDLQIKMTPPSHYREISENEVKDARVNRLATLKGTMAYSDFDLLTRVMHEPEDEAKEIVSRSMIQKLQELKLQVMSQNPQLLGIAMPEPGKNEMGMDGQGPKEMPGQEQEQPQGEMETEDNPEGGAMDTYGKQPKLKQGVAIPNPSENDIRQYDMDIEYAKFIDEEEIDEIEIG